MAFQIKDFASIAASMINWMKAVTTKISDFNVGSVARTLVEAPAAEMDELYQNILIGLKEAIPVSVFTTFGFDLIAAVAAAGVVRFSTGGPLAAVAITIPVGTIVKVPNSTRTYATQAVGTIEIGQSYVDILVAAQIAGSAGNTANDTITELSTPVTGVATVNNPAPLTNGREAETDEERKERFQAYISTLARGTKAAIVYGAKTAKLVDSNGLTTEYVAHANVIEPYVDTPTEPISLVNLYIHNGASATSIDLVNEAKKIIDGYTTPAGVAVPGWKAAGVKVVAAAAADLAVNVTANLTVTSSGVEASAIAAAVDAVKAYIQGLDVGETVIRSELIAIIMRDVPDVYNVSLTAPASDVTCTASQKAIPGTVTIT